MERLTTNALSPLFATLLLSVAAALLGAQPLAAADATSGMGRSEARAQAPDEVHRHGGPVFGDDGALDDKGQGEGAQGEGAQGGEPRPADQQPEAHSGHITTMGSPTGAFFVDQFEHLEPHKAFDVSISKNPEVNKFFAFYDVNTFQGIGLLLMLVIFGLVLSTIRSPGAPWILRVFRGWCHWLRDEVIYKVMGPEEGAKYAPFFLYMFFFVAFSNLLGLVPGSVTATATLFVTAALALITFGFMLIGGIREHGVFGYFKSLIPHGLPPALVPLMAVIELVGLFIKPFALMVRLFANMLAGHLLIYSFVGVIFVFAQLFEMGFASWLTLPLGIGMGWFISIIEAFVSLLQAYIFTYLSVLFVQQSLHPAH